MYQRTGPPRVSIRGQRKIEQKTQHKKNIRAVIGVSTVPLSSRFTHLADETTPRTAKKKKQQQQQHQVTVVKRPKKKGKEQAVLHVVGGKKKMKVLVFDSNQIRQQKKLQEVTQNNRKKRQEVVSKHRKGLSTQDVKMKEDWTKKKSAFVQQNGERGAGYGGRGGRGSRGGRGGRRGRGGIKAKPLTGKDLDMDMDVYWHEAGKGPDPKAVQLDRQMEEYWAAKPTQNSDAASSTKIEPAPDATMES
ncbi:unnamed protein product [Peronospora belbahrii]|uniref:Chromatin target of PRMT1 protein C-terminal domain-containing protein n=1 Tax=Peronospora belbahrii TaxID=622444 RepID=A0ABN8CXU9_9STRA|nr:unnamed protein product [Peronospora belbahrii]